MKLQAVFLDKEFGARVIRPIFMTYESGTVLFFHCLNPPLIPSFVIVCTWSLESISVIHLPPVLVQTFSKHCSQSLYLCHQ